MPTDTDSRSLDAMRRQSWCFVSISAFAPLLLFPIGGPMMKAVLQAAGWLLLFESLRALVKSPPSIATARLSRLLLWMSGFGFIAAFVAHLPPWLIPQQIVACIAYLPISILVVGLGILIGRVSRIFASRGMNALAIRWRRASIAWHITYSVGWGGLVVSSIVLHLSGHRAFNTITVASPLVFCVLIVVALLPSYLVYSAARHTRSVLKRREDLCPNCGYSRAGLPNDRCPECGAAAGRPPSAAVCESEQAVVVERSLWIPATVASLALAVAVWMNPRTCPPGWRPTWMLIRDAMMTRSTERHDPFGFTFWQHLPNYSLWCSEEALRAQAELKTRLAAGTVHRDALQIIVERAFEVQSDSSREPGEWPDLFAEVVKSGSVTPTDLDRYLFHCVRFVLSPRSPVAQGDPVPFQLLKEWRGPSHAYSAVVPTASAMIQALEIQVERITVDGQEMGSGPAAGAFVPSSSDGRITTFSFNDSLHGGSWSLPLAVAEPGQRLMSVQIATRLRPGISAIFPTVAQMAPSFAADRSFTLTAPLTILPRKSVSITRVNDEALRSTMTHVYEAGVWHGPPNSAYLHLTATGTLPSPVDEFGFELILRVDEQEFSLGSASLPGNWMDNILGRAIPREAADRLAKPDSKRTVILRPSVAAAERTQRARRILEGGDLEFTPKITKR